MNRRITFWKRMLITGGIIFSLQMAVPAEAAFGNTLLKAGMSGSDVKLLQGELKALGYFTSSETGYFGLVTRNAVIRFQKANGLAVDGIVGPNTFRVLKKKMLQGDIVATAARYKGVPYTWGGQSPSGFDCSGLSSYVFAKNGLRLPRTSADQYKSGVPISKKSLEVGDLVFFSTYKPGPSHLGIYIGDSKFIHASSSKGVTVSSMSNTYWSARYLGSRSYF